MGSKGKIAKHIIPLLGNPEVLIEPFCGSCSIIKEFKCTRIASDNNYYLIEMFKSLQNGWIPPDYISREDYYKIKFNKDKYEPCLVGFVGFGCSYAGKWFDGYANDKSGKRNYCKESKNSLVKDINKFLDIKFECKDYKDIKMNGTYYCDPPYRGTRKYHSKFDSEEFWNWVREISKSNKVYVSEYEAPSDFKVVWEKEVIQFTRNNSYDRKVEKLFIKDNQC